MRQLRLLKDMRGLSIYLLLTTINLKLAHGLIELSPSLNVPNVSDYGLKFILSITNSKHSDISGCSFSIVIVPFINISFPNFLNSIPIQHYRKLHTNYNDILDNYMPIIYNNNSNVKVLPYFIKVTPFQHVFHPKNEEVIQYESRGVPPASDTQLRKPSTVHYLIGNFDIIFKRRTLVNKVFFRYIVTSMLDYFSYHPSIHVRNNYFIINHFEDNVVQMAHSKKSYRWSASDLVNLYRLNNVAYIKPSKSSMISVLPLCSSKHRKYTVKLINGTLRSANVNIYPDIKCAFVNESLLMSLDNMWAPDVIPFWARVRSYVGNRDNRIRETEKVGQLSYSHSIKRQTTFLMSRRMYLKGTHIDLARIFASSLGTDAGFVYDYVGLGHGRIQAKHYPSYDVTIGNSDLSPGKTTSVDLHNNFETVMMEEKHVMHMLTPKGKTTPRWKSLLVVWSVWVWISMAGCIFGIGLIEMLTGLVLPKQVEVGNPSHCNFMNIFAVLLLQGVNIPSWYSTTGLMVTWIFCAFVLSTVYKGLLVLEFYKPSMDYPPDNLMELLTQKDNYEIVIPTVQHRNWLKGSYIRDSIINASVYNGYPKGSKNPDSLTKTCALLEEIKKRKVVWIDAPNQMDSGIKLCQSQKHKTMENLVFGSEEISNMVSNANFIIRRRNTGLANHVEMIMSRVRAASISTYMTNKYKNLENPFLKSLTKLYPEIHNTKNDRAAYKGDLEKLRVEHILSLFFVFLGGIVSALLCFLVEIVEQRYTQIYRVIHRRCRCHTF